MERKKGMRGANETKDISRETWKHFIPNAIVFHVVGNLP
jgi:hypothetical protein